jgi:uncharacterized membrane protein
MVKVDVPPNLPDATWARPSSDGRVGFVNAAPAFGDTLHVPQGFRWTQTSGAVALGVPGAKGSQILAVTPDGGTVFGVTFDASGRDLFRWTEAAGIITVPRLVGYDECVPESRNMSADGKVILGACSGPSGKQVFRWTEASGMQPLAPPQGTMDDGAHALTPDGAALVGFSHDATSSQAFRWTERTGMMRLGVLPGYEWSSTGSSNQLSDDGAIVIGACSGHWDGGLPQRLGFRWTEASGMVALGALPGSNGSIAENISADGSVIAGESLVSSLSLDPAQQATIAVYWDAGGNVTSLATALAGAGVDLQGFKLEYAYVSPPDGHLFWGIGSTREGERRGWIARVP